jgi:hypothetical protein
MKKVLFLFAFAGLVAFTAEAQSKACCAGKTAAKSSCAETTAAADKAAAADESIVRQVSTNGDVSYARKAVCPASGKVSLTAVEYNAEAGKFVNMSPAEAVSCGSSAAKAVKVTGKGKKSCCAGGGEKAACGSKATKTASSAGESKARLVSNESN